MNNSYRRGLSFRPSLKQKQRNIAQQYLAFQDKAAEDAKLADPAVHERVKRSILEHRAWAQTAAQAPRPRAPRLPRADAIHKEPLERDIQSAIMEALQLHPRVIKVVRTNSGGSMYRGKDGRDHLVLFTSEPVVDLHIMLRNPGRLGWLEVKRPSWKRPTDEREERQARFLACVREAGGIGCFVRSVEEAIAAIAG